jgi:hypothetical protein
MSILMPKIVGHCSSQHNVAYDVEANQRVDELVLRWTNRSESRIENKKIIFLQLADSCASAVASVAVSEVLEVWVEMHLSFAQFLGESQISMQVT